MKYTKNDIREKLWCIFNFKKVKEIIEDGFEGCGELYYDEETGNSFLNIAIMATGGYSGMYRAFISAYVSEEYAESLSDDEVNDEYFQITQEVAEEFQSLFIGILPEFDLRGGIFNIDSQEDIILQLIQ